MKKNEFTEKTYFILKFEFRLFLKKNTIKIEYSRFVLPNCNYYKTVIIILCKKILSFKIFSWPHPIPQLLQSKISLIFSKCHSYFPDPWAFPSQTLKHHQHHFGPINRNKITLCLSVTSEGFWKAWPPINLIGTFSREWPCSLKLGTHNSVEATTSNSLGNSMELKNSSPTQLREFDMWKRKSWNQKINWFRFNRILTCIKMKVDNVPKKGDNS